MNTKEIVEFVFLFPAPSNILLQYTRLHKIKKCKSRYVNILYLIIMYYNWTFSVPMILLVQRSFWPRRQ